MLSTAIIAGAVMVWVVWLWRTYKAELATGIPGPGKIPFFGSIMNTLRLFRNREQALDYVSSYFDRYGDVWSMKGIFGPRLVFIRDAASLKFMLTQPDVFIKGPDFRTWMGELLGDGIFNANGPTWFSQRKTASHMFKISNLRDMIPVFEKHCDHLLQHFDTCAKANERTDVQDAYMLFTLDSISEIGFGVQLESDHQFSDAFNTAQFSVAKRFNNPFLRLLGPFRRFWPSERELHESVTVLDRFSYRAIAERRQDPDVASKTDLLSRYISLGVDEDGKPFSDKYLRDIILNFHLAGRDTTAATLTWCSWALSMHPEVFEKLKEEVETKIGYDKPSYDVIRKLPYVKAVIEETLRLYGAVPWDPKFVMDTVKLPNGMTIGGNSVVSWMAYAMGRNERVWKDAKKFDPDRWLGFTPAPYTHIPFQAGSRTCLGKQMAMLEVSYVLIRLIQAGFYFECPTDYVPCYIPSITFTARDGMQLFIKRK